MKKCSSSWMTSLLCLKYSIAQSLSAKTKFLYNTGLILFADLLYWKMTFFFFFCSLENGDWSHLRISKLQMDEAAQPAHVFRFSSLTNRPFPFTVTEAPEPAAHLIPKVSLTCSYTSGTSVGITVLWKPPDPHSTRSVPGLIPFCPSSGGKAPTGCSLSTLSICMPRTGKGSEMDLMLNYLSPR